METAQKRPISLTIIAWFLIVVAVLGLLAQAAAFLMSSNPAMAKAIAQMHEPMALQGTQVVLAVINLIVAYGIFKGQPWARVLYVVGAIVGLAAGFMMSPQKLGVVLGLIILIVISIFLYSEKANDWFSARGFMLKRED